MKKKFFAIIMAVMATSAILAGCQGKDTKKQEETGKKAETVTVQDAKGKVEIPAERKQ